jgi:cytochrome c-type biogenesis protein CcmF
MTPLILAMAVGPYLAWKRANLAAAMDRLKMAAVIAGVVFAAVFWWDGQEVGAAFGMLLAAWLGVGTLVEWAERVRLFTGAPSTLWRRIKGVPRAHHGMSLAHFGTAIVIMAITASSFWVVEKVQNLAFGESVEVGRYIYTLHGVQEVAGPNYIAREAEISVTDLDGNPVAVLHPQKRMYPVQGMPTTEAGIYSMIDGDLYAVLGDLSGDNSWVTRFYFEPLIPWMWAGCIIMTLGGLVSLTDRRYRIGAPSRKKKDEAPTEASPSPAE